MSNLKVTDPARVALMNEFRDKLVAESERIRKELGITALEECVLLLNVSATQFRVSGLNRPTFIETAKLAFDQVKLKN